MLMSWIGLCRSSFMAGSWNKHWYTKKGRSQMGLDERKTGEFESHAWNKLGIIAY